MPPPIHMWQGAHLNLPLALLDLQDNFSALYDNCTLYSL